MSYFSYFYSEDYNKAHNYDFRFFNHNKAIQRLYSRHPFTARLAALPVMLVWSGIKTVLSPVIDLVCAVVFPIMFLKTFKPKHLWAGVNAIINLAFVGAVITLTIFSIGTGYQTLMIGVCISVAINQWGPKAIESLYVALRGPLNDEEPKGLISTLFHRFSLKKVCCGFLHRKEVKEVIWPGPGAPTITDRISNLFSTHKKDLFEAY